MTDLMIFTLGSFVAGIVLTAVLVLQWAALTSTDSAHPVEARVNDEVRVDVGGQRRTGHSN